MSHIWSHCLMCIWPHQLNFIYCVKLLQCKHHINSIQLSCWTILLLLLIMSLLNIGLIKLLLLLTSLALPWFHNFQDFKRYMNFFFPDFQGFILFHNFFCIIIIKKKHSFAVMFKPFIFSVVPLCSHSLFGGLICAHENRDHQSTASLRLL